VSSKDRLTNNDKREYDPCYSPNGKKIVYEGATSGVDDDSSRYEFQIYTMDVGGGGRFQVTYGEAWGTTPSWGSRP
jgi:Tol biopolymer transport system component